MAELGAYLAERGISKEILSIPVSPEYRNLVALRIGKNWESLATCIGIPSEEVFDLKETYPTSPQDQRLGMMKRWEEMYASEATHLKLIQGLEQTGRRDLTEFLINVVVKGPPVCKVKGEEGKQQNATSYKHGAPPPINKPGYLPLRDPSQSAALHSHYGDVGMGTSGPHSEPVNKQVNSPGRMFWNSPPGSAKWPENVPPAAVIRRAVVTPERPLTEAMGRNDLKMFRNHYR